MTITTRVGNFGVVTLTPNRQMQNYDISNVVGPTGDETHCDVLFVDTRYPMVGTLHGYATKTINATGLWDQEVLYCDKTFIPGSTYSLAVVADIDPTVAMTAS